MYNSFSKVKDEGDIKSTLVVVIKCFVIAGGGNISCSCKELNGRNSLDFSSI